MPPKKSKQNNFVQLPNFTDLFIIINHTKRVVLAWTRFSHAISFSPINTFNSNSIREHRPLKRERETERGTWGWPCSTRWWRVVRWCLRNSALLRPQRMRSRDRFLRRSPGTMIPMLPTRRIATYSTSNAPMASPFFVWPTTLPEVSRSLSLPATSCFGFPFGDYLILCCRERNLLELRRESDV